MKSLTKQEMFDRAYRGLASQKWKQSLNAYGSCVFNGPRGRHCAYGWIDRKIPSRYNEGVSIETLRNEGVGIARLLDEDGLRFASVLQTEHDAHDIPRDMRAAFVGLAKEHGLKIPRTRRTK